MTARELSLRARRRQTTKAEIVRSAFALFSKHGYERVSVEMIAAAAGVSRATFFNYFPQKDLILLELTAARAERIRSILADFRDSGGEPTIQGLLALVMQVCEENARISLRSKKLLMEAVFRQMAHGSVLIAREQAIGSLTEILERIPDLRASSKQIAETLFSIFFATMLEWLMRKDVGEPWLVDSMRERFQLLLEGVQ